MLPLVAITERTLCQEPLALRIQKLSDGGFDTIILREKDLDEDAYEKLASNIWQALDESARKKLVFHRFLPRFIHELPTVPSGKHNSDEALRCLHVPLAQLTSNPGIRDSVDVLGTSIHSLEELHQAEALGVDYVIAGHIFETSCKPGMAPRGLTFLETITQAARVPVWAIGGITPDNAPALWRLGAEKLCFRSSAMKEDVDELARAAQVEHS